VTDTQRIREVPPSIRDRPIDVLINNAAKMEVTVAADEALMSLLRQDRLRRRPIGLRRAGRIR